jgi:EAL domain-containing protein (putative c-di-GMP-specific phosphodiesterase class I)
MNMPQINGVEFMRRANEAEYRGGFILLSGEDSSMIEAASNFAAAQNLSILGPIPKPLTIDLLKNILDRLETKKPATTRSDSVSAIEEEELKHGIRSQISSELRILYQPKIEVETGSIIGVEALPVWNHSERGVLGPETFYPLAEQFAMLDELSRKIYKMVGLQIVEWKDKGISLKVSINLSVSLFQDSKFSEYMISSCREYGADPSQIVLQVSAKDIQQEPGDLIEVLMQLRLNQFSTSIDSFSVGNLSVSQLIAFPATELKIDQAFKVGAVDSKVSRATLEASVAQAKDLNLVVVAEGAEQAADWDLGLELGVDYIQGPCCSKPLPNAELLEFLKNWTGRS